MTAVVLRGDPGTWYHDKIGKAFPLAKDQGEFSTYRVHHFDPAYPDRVRWGILHSDCKLVKDMEVLPDGTVRYS